MSLKKGIAKIVTDILAGGSRPYVQTVSEQSKNLQATGGIILLDNGDGTAQVTLVDGSVVTAFYGLQYRFVGDPVAIIANAIM